MMLLTGEKPSECPACGESFDLTVETSSEDTYGRRYYSCSVKGMGIFLPVKLTTYPKKEWKK